MPGDDGSSVAVARAVAEVFRADGARVLAALIASIGDFQLAEDVLQEALASALTAWAADGIPREPAGWLRTTARRRAIDQLRRGANFARKSAAVASLERLRREERAERAASAAEGVDVFADERLRLLFTCCHPALAEPARVALTLRTLGGLETAEIARAFLVTETTMAQRLVRAKRKIAAAGIPYVVPAGDQLEPRLGGVLQVIYLVFNEGYSASAGDGLVRRDLCEEAIRLARTLDQLLPSRAEVMGLLALMLLHDARRPGRTDGQGRLVPLEQQDRGRWDRAQIAEGAALIEATLRLGRVGPYQLQGAIAALHAQAPTPAATDWPQIAALYGLLARIQPSPVVELNRAAAVAMAEGPARGLELLSVLEASGDLAGYSLLPAAQADLHRRLGNVEEALAAYQRALELAGSTPEQTYYRDRMAQLTH